MNANLILFLILLIIKIFAVTIVLFCFWYRQSWIYNVINSWTILVSLYCIINKLDPNEYMKTWPRIYFYIYFWKWHLRDFIVNQEKFDEIVEYWKKKGEMTINESNNKS